ncbi:hypothetical protein EHLJMEHL_04974 [Vreelandella titanicae]
MISGLAYHESLHHYFLSEPRQSIATITFSHSLGPYHPVIDEVRENDYLIDFRRWVSSQNGSASISEVTEMKKQVEYALQEAQDELFLKHLDHKRHFKTVGEAMLGDLAGLVYPLAGTTKAVFDTGKELVKPTNQKWQGFIVGAKREFSRSKYA